MSLETSSPEAAPESTSSVSDSPVSSTSSGYSVTDPGYEAAQDDADGDVLAQLRAENTKPADSDAETETTEDPPETSDDASDSEETDAEETVKQPFEESTESADISDDLLDRAIELGYTLDEIKAFRDERSLEKEVSRVEKIHKRLQERSGKSPANEAPAEEAKPEPNWDELIEQGHDPDMIALQKQNWKEAQDAKALAQQVIQAERTRAFEAQCDRFDETLNKLTGFEGIFGNGRRGELLKSSPEQAANRQKVFTKMQILRRGYEEAGERVPAESELIQEAVQASFYKHAQEIARKELKRQIKKAGSQALSRPRSGGDKPLSGPSLALVKEQEFWKRHS